MTVFYTPRPDSGSGPRIGFTVPRALGVAVNRNRIKRRMREAVRHNFAGLQSSVDVVFNPKKQVLEADFVQIEQEVKRAFEVIQKAASRMEATNLTKERSTAQ